MKNLIASNTPGVLLAVGSISLPGLAAVASGFMGAAWFGVQIFIALEKRANERRRAKQDNRDAE